MGQNYAALVTFLLLGVIHSKVPSMIITLANRPDALSAFKCSVFTSSVLKFTNFMFLFFHAYRAFSRYFVNCTTSFIVRISNWQSSSTVTRYPLSFAYEDNLSRTLLGPSFTYTRPRDRTGADWHGAV